MYCVFSIICVMFDNLAMQLYNFASFLVLLSLPPSVPCAPEGLQLNLRPMRDDRQVLQATWNSVECPDAQYLLEITGSLLGDPQMLFEFSSYWTTKSFFEMPIPCSSTYNVTLKAKSSAGVSPPSAVVAGTTGSVLFLSVFYKLGMDSPLCC